jgi:hypothetical protein
MREVIETQAGRVEINCWYDDRCDDRGWYAEYAAYRTGDRYPCATDDSAKIWAETMPRRIDAERAARRVARRAARRMLAQLSE